MSKKGAQRAPCDPGAHGARYLLFFQACGTRFPACRMGLMPSCLLKPLIQTIPCKRVAGSNTPVDFFIRNAFRTLGAGGLRL